MLLAIQYLSTLHLRNNHFVASPLSISPSTTVSPSICGYFEHITLNPITLKGSTFRNVSFFSY